jgi:two-component system cell cycle response regulator
MKTTAPNTYDELAPKMEDNAALYNTVLVADDDPIFRCLIESKLTSWGYKVIVVDNGIAAWDEIGRDQSTVHLIILDWLMPGIKGIELCRRIRQQQDKEYRYILLISGKDDKQNVVDGLEAGADDYLTKPFDVGELRARLRTGVRILSLQHNLVKARDELRYRATHDTLTGVWSRGAVLELLVNELQRASRTGAPTGVLMIDLDHFKHINDAHGHLAGDAVLTEVAHRISRSVRSYDFVGRYGGEEFITVLSNCSEEQLRRVAERIRFDIESSPAIRSPENVSVTASLGGCITWNSATSDLELLSTADAALYKAKRSGRNRAVIASSHGIGQACQGTRTSH